MAKWWDVNSEIRTQKTMSVCLSLSFFLSVLLALLPQLLCAGLMKQAGDDHVARS